MDFNYQLEEAKDSSHAMPPSDLNTVHATTRLHQGANQRGHATPAMIRNGILMTNGAGFGGVADLAMISGAMSSSSASFLEQANRIDEENNHFTSNESALINKVNEMQTKAASFGY